jgi:hypothetical protein
MHYGGAWGERTCKSNSFLSSALEGNNWSASRPGRALHLETGVSEPVVQEALWAAKTVWTQRLEEKPSASARDRTPVIKSVVKHYK